MPLAIVKTKIPSRQSDPLAELLQQRDSLHGEFARLQKPEATRSAAAAAVAATEVELRALDAADRDAWGAWAADPAGEAPTPHAHKRQDIERRRALAAADLRGAEVAVAGTQERQNQILAELRSLGPQLYAIKLESVLDELPEIERNIAEAHATITSNLTNLRGLFDALSQEKSAADNRGDQASASLIQGAMSKVESLRKPEGAASWADVQSAAARWRERLK
jgi:hypothetical protein